MSLSQEILQLESALRREKVSPEILMYEETLVGKILTGIEEKQEILDSTPTETIEQQFEYQIYQLDLDRIKYLLSNYLRTRLIKIQSLAITIAINEQAEMLSTTEFDFLKKYYILKTNHFKRSFLLKIPEQFRKIEHEEHSKSPDSLPNMEKYVFIKALEEIGTYHLETGEDIDIHKDDIFLLPYISIKPLLLANKVDVV